MANTSLNRSGASSRPVRSRRSPAWAARCASGGTPTSATSRPAERTTAARRQRRHRAPTAHRPRLPQPRQLPAPHAPGRRRTTPPTGSAMRRDDGPLTLLARRAEARLPGVVVIGLSGFWQRRGPERLARGRDRPSPTAPAHEITCSAAVLASRPAGHQLRFRVPFRKESKVYFAVTAWRLTSCWIASSALSARD